MKFLDQFLDVKAQTLRLKRKVEAQNSLIKSLQKTNAELKMNEAKTRAELETLKVKVETNSVLVDIKKEQKLITNLLVGRQQTEKTVSQYVQSRSRSVGCSRV